MTVRTWPDRRMLIGVLLLAASAAALAIWWRFETDMQTARSRIAKGSIVVETRCAWGTDRFEPNGFGRSLGRNLRAARGLGCAIGGPLGFRPKR